MEENVALDSSNQKKFVKSIKGIKKLLKKNDQNVQKSETKKKSEKAKPQKMFSMRLKKDHGKIFKKKPMQRGLVYLAHIPHGFYEHQMTQYFKQFGVVTNARVIRSKRTGNSKGFAFVEFKDPSVAQIVAETMNNYLMGKRLIKAAYIPPEKIRRNAFRKKWNTVHNPTSVRRMKLNKEFNAEKGEDQNLKKAKKLLSNLNKTKKKLSELGINYDFFTPVDVPTALLNSVIKQEKDDEIKKEEDKPKKRKIQQNEKQIEKKIGKKEKVKNGKNINKKETNEKVNKLTVIKENKKDTNKELIYKPNKKDKKLPQINTKEQKIKEQKLKAAGVKPAEFISVEADSSDESCEFDSDEYEKILEEDSSEVSSDDSKENKRKSRSLI